MVVAMVGAMDGIRFATVVGTMVGTRVGILFRANSIAKANAMVNAMIRSIDYCRYLSIVEPVGVEFPSGDLFNEFSMKSIHYGAGGFCVSK